MDSAGQIFFQSQEPPPRPTWLRAGLVSCLYESGNLRYLSAGGRELVRMIYPAVRAADWVTVPSVIEEEKLDAGPDHFEIRYLRRFILKEIHYEARIVIKGHPDSRIEVRFSGISKSSFLRNRIGLCVLLPIEGCSGKSCVITEPSGKKLGAGFPTFVSPDQPFRNIQSIEWAWAHKSRIRISFSGDVFEAEDQRNWADASYKIYSTPLEIPYPVAVQPGHQAEQKVSIRVDGEDPTEKEDFPKPYIVESGEGELPFPALGCSEGPGAAAFSEEQVKRLKALQLTHYRHSVIFLEGWTGRLGRAVEQCRLMDWKLELAVFFSGAYESQVQELAGLLSGRKEMIHSMLILHEHHPVMPGHLFGKIRALLDAHFAKVPLGIGTDAYFAEWNRGIQAPEGADFTSYSVIPQAHAEDARTMVENLQGMGYGLATALHRFPGLDVHVSPISLGSRYNMHLPVREQYGSLAQIQEASADPRQASLFAAAWTLLCIRWLRGAKSLTFFEAAGARGIIPGYPHHWMRANGEFPVSVFPVFLAFSIFRSFRPVTILDSWSSHPLEIDALVLRNARGRHMLLLCHFGAQPRQVQIRMKLDTVGNRWQKMEITTGNLRHHLEDPSSLLDSGEYLPGFGGEGAMEIPGYSILIITNWTNKES